MEQPETLDSITCHTFPGLGGRAFNVLLYNFQFFCAKGLVEIPALANNFIVIPALFEPLPGLCVHKPATRTSKSTWRLAEGCFGPT